MRTIGILALFSILLVLPETLGAEGLPQGGGLETQSLRGYTHMFIAYAIAWLLIVGWVVAIARRLGRIEKALND
jgi:CcmD family protein